MTHPAILNMLERYDLTNADSSYPFIRDSRELDLWSAQFFMQVIQQIK